MFIKIIAAFKIVFFGFLWSSDDETFIYLSRLVLQASLWAQFWLLGMTDWCEGTKTCLSVLSAEQLQRVHWVQNSHGMGWGLCWDGIGVQLPLFPSSASFTLSQVLTSGAFPSKLPAYRFPCFQNYFPVKPKWRQKENGKMRFINFYFFRDNILEWKLNMLSNPRHWSFLGIISGKFLYLSEPVFSSWKSDFTRGWRPSYRSTWQNTGALYREACTWVMVNH